MIDTAPLFRPLLRELVGLLEDLEPADWLRPTVAGDWRVRDVVSHLIDGDLRRISAQRDDHRPPPPAQPIDSHRQLVAFLNELNRDWIRAFDRLSPRVLLELVRTTGAACAEVLERVDPVSRALYPVAWAGESESLAWMDVGREFTEKWHHQQQIRDAVGAPLLLDERWTDPLFRLSILALPRAYSEVAAAEGTCVEVGIEGPGGGTWSLVAVGHGWELREGTHDPAHARVRLSPDEAWRLFYNALTPEQQARIQVDGDDDLAKPLLAARSVMV